jgi:ankyrin repeat protein
MRNLLAKAVRYVKCNNRKRLGWLLNRYPHLKTAFDHAHDSALAWAAYLNNAGMLPWLLQQGVNPDTPDSGGGTLLMAAGETNDMELVQLLQRHGADINLRNHRGETAFSYACANDSLAVAKLLFLSGADINTIDVGGGSPLDWAVCWSSPEFRDWLTSVGGKRHDDRYAPWRWPVASTAGCRATPRAEDSVCE